MFLRIYTNFRIFVAIYKQFFYQTKKRQKKTPEYHSDVSAQNRTRTCTTLRLLVPETSASTNSAIWANKLQVQSLRFQVNWFQNNNETYNLKHRTNLCPGQDSNLHIRTDTSPSSWRVYQFHHLGKRSAKVIILENQLLNFKYFIWETPLMVLIASCQSSYKLLTLPP